MGDVINIKSRLKEPPSDEMFNLTVYIDKNKEYEVYLEVSDKFTDLEIYIAAMTAMQKYANDMNIDIVIEDEDDDTTD